MRFGVVILPDARWAEARERWQRAEELGFAHAWTYDHLTWRSLRDGPWFGAVPTLAAAATSTERIRLGTLVASPNFRHPVPFAKELMSLDDLSAGRFSLGIGAGGSGFDATALGQEAWTPRERAGRFEEFVSFLDALLSEPSLTREGRFYRANDARGLPGCVQRPRLPFAIAAGGARGMQLAARHAQTWVTVDGRGDHARQVDALAAACAAEGRAAGDIDRLVLLGLESDPLESEAVFARAVAHYEALGFTDLVVHWPRSEPPFAAHPTVFEAVVREWVSG